MCDSKSETETCFSQTSCKNSLAEIKYLDKNCIRVSHFNGMLYGKFCAFPSYKSQDMPITITFQIQSNRVQDIANLGNYPKPEVKKISQTYYSLFVKTEESKNVSHQFYQIWLNTISTLLCNFMLSTSCL